MIYELFSARKKKLENSGLQDVYSYDTLPTSLRVQIQQILADAIGPQYYLDQYGGTQHHNPDAWEFIHKTLCRELGRNHLGNESDLPCNQVMTFIANCSVDNFLDVVELCGWIIEKIVGPYNDHQRRQYGIEQNSADALKEINYRFRNANFGFQIENCEIIRFDNEFTHEEIIKPALKLLSAPEFSGTQAEFLSAHAHYRGNYPLATLRV